ncbi:MAG: hypothetical protein U0270_36395 [Labilithrix sp.]
MSGDLKMTLDELDAAFEAGRIHSRTLVRRRGTVRWETLGKMAGLDDASDAPPSEVVGPIVEVARPAIPRPAVPRPATRPPPLPASESVGVMPADVVAHVSSLPPPVTVSTREPSPSPSLGEDTVDAIEGLRPRRGRGRLFAAVFFAALVGGIVVTAVKFPSLPARVTTALHREEIAAPPSAQALPPSSAPVAPVASVAPSARPAIGRPPPASAARTIVAPAKSAAPRSKSGAKPGALHATR